MTPPFDLDALVRPNIRSLVPYRCARDDYDSGILLDANENSIGAVTGDDGLNRYPDPHQNELRAKIAAIRGCRPDQIFCGVGSDEAIDLLIRIFCVPGKDSIVITPPTYGMYKVAAKVNDVGVIDWPLTPDFQLDLDTLTPGLSRGSLSEAKVLFLCSPNNPTANNLRREDIIRVIESFPGIVVVDEAYIDFTDQKSFVPELDRYPNLVVLQTFSKSYGLAGIRLGLAFASEALISWMLRVKAPYNINKLTTEVALRALEQTETFQANVALLNDEREKVALALTGIPAVKKVHPSDSNFILAVVDNAYSVYKTMADAGVVIRYRGDQLHCESTVRITIGTPDENERMLAMLREVTS
jgi:histidinol-phosphate aminotransferase